MSTRDDGQLFRRVLEEFGIEKHSPMPYHSAEHAEAMASIEEAAGTTVRRGAMGTDVSPLPGRPRADQQDPALTGGELLEAFRAGWQLAETEGTTIPQEASPAAAFSKGRRLARPDESPETPGM